MKNQLTEDVKTAYQLGFRKALEEIRLHLENGDDRNIDVICQELEDWYFPNLKYKGFVLYE